MKGYEVEIQRLVAGAICCILSSWPATGKTEESGPNPGVFTLGQIEVTGKADIQKNVTVETISSEEMREFDRNTLGDAATLLPGVTSSMSGARNEQTLYIRGLDIKHVPIYLDGIPIYVPYDGYPDLSRFSTFDLSEVVVSKGFSSVLYGPNTMGGAINMISRRPEKTFEGGAGAGVNSDGAYNAYTNIGTNQETWYLQVGASYLSSEYYTLSDDFNDTATENGGHRENSYRRDGKVSFKVGFTPNENDEYAFSYSYQHGKKGTPPYAGTSDSQRIRYWRWPYWDKESYYFTSRTTFTGIGYLKTRLFYDTFRNSLFAFDDDTYSTMNRGSSFKSKYDDYTDGGSIEIGTPLIPNNLVKLALHYKQDVHREHNSGSPHQRFEDWVWSAGLEDTITFSDRLYAIAGVSYDAVDTREAEDVDSDGKIANFPKDSTGHFNPQLGIFYSPSEASTLHASVAMKTRLPSIKDKYSYRLGRAIPNPELDPERSVNYEIGYEDKHIRDTRWQVNAFFNDITDYIELVDVPDPGDPGRTIEQNKNIGKVDIYGLELEALSYLTSSLAVGGNYTYIKAHNRSDSNKLRDVPKHKIFAYLHYTATDRLTLQTDVEYNSKRYSATDGSRVAGHFTVTNFKLGYDFDRGFRAEAGIKNLFDKNYAIDEGYPEAGRTFFANLRYTF
ncbi:MAG: TonB-dependent receptor plug domain-containing protein [Desulfopila sp.]